MTLRDYLNLCRPPREPIRPGPFYVRVREGQVGETREIVPGEVFADFDSEGRLLGVEVLGAGQHSGPVAPDHS